MKRSTTKGIFLLAGLFLIIGCDKPAPELSEPSSRTIDTPQEEITLPENSGGEDDFLSLHEFSCPKEGGSVVVTADSKWEFRQIVYNETGCPYPSESWTEGSEEIKQHSFLPANMVELEDGSTMFYQYEDALRIPPSFNLVLGCESLEPAILGGEVYINGAISGSANTYGYRYYGYRPDQSYFVGDVGLWLCRIEGDWFTCERKLEDWFANYEKPAQVITEKIPEGTEFLVDKPNSEYPFTITLEANPTNQARTLIIKCLNFDGFTFDQIVIRQE